MSVKLNENYVKGFISEAEVNNIQPMITTAHNLLRTKQGPGNDFLGWVTLPFDYDKAEFEAIKASAPTRESFSFFIPKFFGSGNVLSIAFRSPQTRCPQNHTRRQMFFGGGSRLSAGNLFYLIF